MIRYAKEQDLLKMLDIYNEAVICTTAVYEYNSRTLAEQLKWYKDKQENGFPLLVYEENNDICGFATYGPFDTLSGFKYTVKDSVYVHRNQRRKHVGTELLAALINLAQKNGCGTIVAEIDNANEGSKKMHENIGFRCTGIIPGAGYKFGAWLDLALYHYELNKIDLNAEMISKSIAF